MSTGDRNPVYDLFSNQPAHSIWRELMPCPYHEATRQRCPFGQHCCFAGGHAEHAKSRQWTDIEREIYTELKALFVDRTPLWRPGLPLVSITERNTAPSCLVTTTTLQLPLLDYMRQHGVTFKRHMCHQRHSTKQALVECSKTADGVHSPVELLTQFNSRFMLEYYQYHMASRHGGKKKAVPQLTRETVLRCTACGCAQLSHIAPTVHTHTSEGALIYPFIEVYCSQCNSTTTLHVYASINSTAEAKEKK